MRRLGTRALQEEKTLVQELGRLFHVARANAREQRVVRRAAAATAGAAEGVGTNPDGSATTEGFGRGAKKHKKGGRDASKKDGSSSGNKPRRTRGPRRKNRGGTVWIVLKGGFARVPTAAMTAVVTRNQNFRGQLSEQRRLSALEAAEAYVQTAWQQAQEAGLLLPDGSGPNGEEGLQYLREQYDVAAGMLRREPVGAHLRQIVESTLPNNAGAIKAAAVAPKPETVYDRDQWADIITRENVILRRFAHSPSSGADTTELVLNEAAEISSKYYFPISEPLGPSERGAPAFTPNSSSGELLPGEQACDVLPTKCIVRIRGSCGKKHTTIISTAKAVNSFKSHFMQVIRKEVSNSRLPRTGNGVEAKQQQQRSSSGGGPTAHAGRGQQKGHSNRRRK